MNFFKNLSISRFVISLYGLQVSRSLKTRKAIKSGLQCTTFFSQILCLQVSVLIIHRHCIQLSFSRAQLSKKFICILSVSLDFFPDLLFYTKIAFRFLEKETLGIVVLQSNGVTNIITVFKSYQHVSRTFLESNWAFCLMQMNVLLSCARGHESKKQYTWIMRTLTCKHKICERKVVHWSPDFIALRVFNDLETCRPYKLMTNLEIDKFLKKFIERFPNNYHICRCRPNYLQKWQQEHLNARSSNPFFSQSVVAIPIILYTQF